MTDPMDDRARVESLFHAVVDLPPDDARCVLERECLHAPALRDEVERLLWHDRRISAEFLAPDARLWSDALASAERSGESSWSPERVFRPDETVGRFRILRPLGEGAMGVVYVAHDPALDRSIALKVLRRGPARPESLAFEARALARVTHPNVVQVHELGEHEGRPFVAMELVWGRSLRAWLAERTRTAVETMHMFVQAGRGLSAVHEAGLVHRDFKPDNVLVGADGRVRVVDFGISALRARADSFDDDVLAPGTPAFMAPEQFAGQPATAASDQFAFCVALYRALYGAAPFAGDDVRALGRNVVDGKLVTPPPRADVPAWIARIVTRGLALEPGKRFPSMKHLVSAIERRLPRLELDPSVGRRERRLIAAVIGAMGAATLASIVASWRATGAEPTMRQMVVIPSIGLAGHAIGAVVWRRRLLGNRFAQKISFVIWMGIATCVVHRLIALRFGQPIPQVLAVDMMVLATQHAIAAVLFEPLFGVTAALFLAGAMVATASTQLAVPVMLGSVITAYVLGALRIGL